MKNSPAPFSLITLLSVITLSQSFAQNVGINASGAAPHAAAMLHIDLGSNLTKGLLVTGTFNASATIPDLNAGSRLMFYPGKGAFRAGYVDGEQWNTINVGTASVAMGYGTTASGAASIALGGYTNASGNYSMATGIYTTASGLYATAMGYLSNASGAVSMAMGGNTIASGHYSTAMGYNSTASGQSSVAMGHNTTASGPYSLAMGYLTKAHGDHSTVMGYNSTASGALSVAAGTNVSTNNKRGAFFFGDSDPNLKGVRAIGFADQYAARFNGGYYFISSDAGSDIGVQVLAGGNAWVAICDENRKENFAPLDGETILQKMKDMKFSSWNYKTQDPAIHRHYGVMAQDFFDAFGNDQFGKIGNDTTVNPIDMIGIDMAAIQALEKRTAELTQENTELRNEMNELKARLLKIEKKN